MAFVRTHPGRGSSELVVAQADGGNARVRATRHRVRGPYRLGTGRAAPRRRRDARSRLARPRFAGAESIRTDAPSSSRLSLAMARNPCGSFRSPGERPGRFRIDSPRTSGYRWTASPWHSSLWTIRVGPSMSSARCPTVRRRKWAAAGGPPPSGRPAAPGQQGNPLRHRVARECLGLDVRWRRAAAPAPDHALHRRPPDPRRRLVTRRHASRRRTRDADQRHRADQGTEEIDASRLTRHDCAAASGTRPPEPPPRQTASPAGAPLRESAPRTPSPRSGRRSSRSMSGPGRSSARRCTR